MRHIDASFTKIIIVSVATLLCLPAAFAAEGTFDVEEGFLSVGLDQLNIVREEEGGIDLIYKPPEIYERLVNYDKIMIDQPEIWIDPDSKYRGAKPDNIKAIADLMRENLTAKVIDRGYEVVDEPGPGVLYIRPAVTDLYLKKKKRGILAYTPAGAVVKLGADAIRDMMSKIDIIEVAIQMEFQDSVTQEVLGAIIIKRGARKNKETGQKLTRYDFKYLRLEMHYYGGRLACSLDNARTPDGQQVDCEKVGALVDAGYLVLPDWYEPQ
jgi:hypothetical protein